MEPATSSEFRAASCYILTISTGHLPPPEQVKGPVDKACVRYRVNTNGQNSQVYPALARVPREMFGCMGSATRNTNSR
jgi:glutaminase